MTTREWVAIPLVFLTATLVFCYPLSVEPGARALDLGPDTRLYLWTLAWDVHALTSDPLSLLDANIFYPQPRTLAYSEHLLASSLFASPWVNATGNPLLGLNAVGLFSCLACGVGAYFLARTLGLGVAASLTCGMVFAFAPPRFLRLGQVHLGSVQWIPFCLAFVHRYARGGASRDALAAGFFFTAQALTGGQSALFLAIGAALLLFYLRVVGELQPRSRPARDAGAVAALVLTLNAPFVLPYYAVRRDLGLKRDLQEARTFSPNAASFLAAPTHVQKRLLPRRLFRNANAYLFPGFTTLALALVSLRRKSKPRALMAEPWPAVLLDALTLLFAAAALAVEALGGIRMEVAGIAFSARGGGRLALAALLLLGVRLLWRPAPPRWLSLLKREAEARAGLHASFYAALAFLSVWAALGPSWGLYSVLYKIVPGFDFIRAPGRLTLLTILALAVLAAAGLERIQSNALRAAALSLMALEFAAFPLDAPLYSIPRRPVDAWLRNQPGRFAVVELPVADPRDGVRSAQLHSLYMLESTAHFKDLVNGYSGFTPPSHDALFRELVSFPNDGSLTTLETWGVRYAVVNRRLYPLREWQEVDRKLDASASRLSLVHEDDETRVYALTRSKARPDRGE